MEWLAHPPLVGGGGVSTTHLSDDIFKACHKLLVV